MKDKTPDLSEAPHPIIHINGFPGTGKKTIATHLERKLSSSGLPAQLTHNHVLINPAKLPRTHPGYQAERKAIRNEYFKPLIEDHNTYGTTYIFTDFQSTDAIGSSVCEEYAALAAKRGCMLIPILLFCDEAENLSRAVSDDRAEHGKLTDAGVVRNLLRNGTVVYRFSADTESLELDVTKLPAEEAANILHQHVLKLYRRLDGVTEAKVVAAQD
jgi:hypothetical protein